MVDGCLLLLLQDSSDSSKGDAQRETAPKGAQLAKLKEEIKKLREEKKADRRKATADQKKTREKLQRATAKVQDTQEKLTFTKKKNFPRPSPSSDRSGTKTRPMTSHKNSSVPQTQKKLKMSYRSS